MCVPASWACRSSGRRRARRTWRRPITAATRSTTRAWRKEGRDGHRARREDRRGHGRVPHAAHAVHPVLLGLRDERLLQVPAVNTTITGVFTNKMATDAIRGAGRPEATHLLEVMMDQLAAELGLDPLDVRRATNFIPTENFPNADVAVGITYDSGDYFGSLTSCWRTSTSTPSARSRAQLREQASTAASASPPGWRSAASRPRAWSAPAASASSQAGWESALVRVHPSGSATVYTGTSPHGQGHETGFAQIVADRIGVTPDQSRSSTATHRPGPVRPGHLRLAHAGRRWRVRRPGGRQGAREGEQDRRAPAGGLARRHRAARRQVPGARLTGPGAGAGRHLARRLRAREPARGHGAGARGDQLLRPRELRVPLRPTPRSWTWTSRRARSPSCATWRWTTAARRSTRCSSTGRSTAGSSTGSRRRSYEQVVYDEDGQLVTGTFVDYALPPRRRCRPSRRTAPRPRRGELARRQGHRRGGHDRRVADHRQRVWSTRCARSA